MYNKNLADKASSVVDVFAQFGAPLYWNKQIF